MVLTDLASSEPLNVPRREEAEAIAGAHPAELVRGVRGSDAEAAGPEVSNHAETEALVRPALARLRSHASKQT